ncbi:MAG: hypothetical protein IKA85_02275 [Clostridia bacterium]|nr:hypothetical protein [Clostridia bacterium]
MKKLFTLFLVLIISIFTLTGCGETPLGFKAQYWHENVATTDFHPLNETIEYDVKVVNKTPSNSAEMKNNDVKMEITNGKYITTLKMLEDENNVPYYSYETELLIEGKYTFKEEVKEFTNDVKSTTLFKTIVNDFMPISTTKSSNKTTTIMSAVNGYALFDFTYSYDVNYGEKDATSKYTLNTIGETKSEPIVKNNTFKKYNDKAYIDSELLLLLPRAFSYEQSFMKSFSSIDVVTQKIQKMRYYAGTEKTEVPDIKSFNLKYNLNGSETGAEDFKAAKVQVLIDDTFSGAAMEAYYAVDHPTHRHRMVKCYTALNDSIGYLEYTIKSVQA